MSDPNLKEIKDTFFPEEEWDDSQQYGGVKRCSCHERLGNCDCCDCVRPLRDALEKVLEYAERMEFFLKNTIAKED